MLLSFSNMPLFYTIWEMKSISYSLNKLFLSFVTISLFCNFICTFRWIAVTFIPSLVNNKTNPGHILKKKLLLISYLHNSLDPFSDFWSLPLQLSISYLPIFRFIITYFHFTLLYIRALDSCKGGILLYKYSSHFCCSFWSCYFMLTDIISISICILSV